MLWSFKQKEERCTGFGISNNIKKISCARSWLFTVSFFVASSSRWRRNGWFIFFFFYISSLYFFLWIFSTFLYQNKIKSGAGGIYSKQTKKKEEALAVPRDDRDVSLQTKPITHASLTIDLVQMPWLILVLYVVPDICLYPTKWCHAGFATRLVER